jgi:predicted nucleotidyltransferase
LLLGVRGIGIFGSVVKGEDLDTSDFDILVEFDEDHHDFKSFNQVCDFFEQSLGENFDLVTKQGLSPYLAEKILQETEYVDLSS